MDARYFSKDFMKAFIEVYQQNPALWKVKSKEYVNKNLKHAAILKLIEVCKRFNIEADKEFVTKKIQSMRGSFRKEMKKVKSSQRSGAATDDLYVPTLWYYDLLLFTVEHENCSESISNLDSPDMFETESQDVPNTPETQDTQETHYENSQDTSVRENETYSDNNTMQTPHERSKRPRPKKRNQEDTSAEFMKACTAALGTSTTSTIGEFDAVGISIGKKLAKMTPIQQVYAEFLIQKVLTLGALQKLNENTDVADKVPQINFATHMPTFSQPTFLSPSASKSATVVSGNICGHSSSSTYSEVYSPSSSNGNSNVSLTDCYSNLH